MYVCASGVKFIDIDELFGKTPSPSARQMAVAGANGEVPSTAKAAAGVAGGASESNDAAEAGPQKHAGG